jgi:CheY-like chemotaxis protein
MTSKLSVLVVDDYVDGREMVAEYLAFRGLNVAQAKGGDEAIELAKKLKPDVILMDLRMPGTDGWEATRQLKANPITSHILIVALTAHAMTAEKESARKAGCDAVVAKPYDLAALSQAMLRVPKVGAAAFDIPGLSLNPSRAATSRNQPRRRLKKRES